MVTLSLARPPFKLGLAGSSRRGMHRDATTRCSPGVVVVTLQPLACHSCGAALPAPAQQDLVKCEFCGAELTVLVAERIEVHQATQIPEAILIAEPMPASRPAPAESPRAPVPPTQAPVERPSRTESQSLDIPPWASRLFLRAIREIFRRR